MLLAFAGAISLLCAFILSLNALIGWQVENSIRDDAVSRAQNWSDNYIRTTPSLRKLVEKGITTPAEIERLETSFALVDVVRFEIFDKDGMLTHLSDTGVLAPSQFFNETALNVFDTGETTAILHKRSNVDKLNAQTYVEVYLPIDLPNADRIGVLEVYVDVSDLEAALKDAFRQISGYLVGGTIVVLLLPALAYVRRTRQLMRKDKQLLELTRYDQLTGTLNRNSITELLKQKFSVVGAEPIGLLFVDIDHFKQVNDQFGHACGDLLLQHIACILKHSTDAEGDQVGRFGGDEFILVCRCADLKEFRCLYGRIMADAGKSFCSDGISYTPSLSIGAYFTSKDDTEKTAIHRADLAVYAAKRRGRNQVVEYSREIEGLFDQETARRLA
ncbi:MAG: diguanylate cyclase [Pseudomonadota bacterium]